MYYLSEYEHIIYLTESEEDAIKYCKRVEHNYAVDTYPYIDDGFIEFERDEFMSTYYISEIPYHTNKLYILQCVSYSGDVKLYIYGNKPECKNSLENWRETSKNFKYDDYFYNHTVELKNGEKMNIYEYELELHKID